MFAMIYCNKSMAQGEVGGGGGSEFPSGEGTLATPEQKARAIYITQDVLDSSIARRERAGNNEELEGRPRWKISGENKIAVDEGYLGPREGRPGDSIDVASRHTDQSFYLSGRLGLGYWWYVSDDSVVNYYDDMITIYFKNLALDQPYVIMIFDDNDYLLAMDTVWYDPRDSLTLSAGTILTGNQSITILDTAVNILATGASGGTCHADSLYHYQWQAAYDSSGFVNITGATNPDSLIVHNPIDTLKRNNHYQVAFRRRVICNGDTAYAGSIMVYLVDTLSAGAISPSDQSIAGGQYPQNLHDTAHGGLCNGAYHYQWQFSTDSITYTNLIGRTADSLLFDNPLYATRYYRCRVACNGDTVYTHSVKITVSGYAPVLKPGVNPYLPAITVIPKKLPDVFVIPAFKHDVKYLRTYVPNIPIQDTAVIDTTATVEDVGISTVYVDTYGRTVEAVTRQTSPLKHDNVVATAYDEFGRSPVNYLPYTASTGDGNFKFNPFYQDSVFYKSLFPNEKINYSETVYDGSPFNIAVSTKAPGNSWAGSDRKTVYSSRANNGLDSVRLWSIDINGEDDIPYTNGYYVAGSLGVQEVRDESNMQSVKYTDEVGRTVMTKTLLSSCLVSGNPVWLCTYYVYDEMNHLRMVIPPKASEALKSTAINWNMSTDSTINKNLCYAYYYDDLGRVIMKRIPGKGKTYIAYDLLNRVVMTQDANLRTTGQWSFALYDGQSRPVKSGLITSSLSKDSVWAQAGRSKNYPTLSGTYKILGETYYDDYSWIASTSAPVLDSLDKTNIDSTNFIASYNTSPDYAQQISKSLRIRGAATGMKKAILNSSDYLYTVTFYDERGRSVQTQQTNYSGGTDVASIQYAFNGRILRSHLKHVKGGTNAQTHIVLTKYTYDHVGRVRSVTKNLDGLGDKTISRVSYNELGQLDKKIIGDSIETQQYSYNIRGWVLGINSDYVKTGSSTSNYFGETLSYDSGFVNTLYNGNIAGIQWKAKGDGIARAYGYSYDKANRLNMADFYQQNTGSTDWTKDKVDYTVSDLGYDANGNILGMKQRGLMVGSSATVDSLTYQYFSNSNLLEKVSDGITDTSPLGDFKDTTASGDDYTYDVNGNITRDNNRHMHSGSDPGAVFNFLDKPDSMVIAGKSGTHYYYDAGGSTLRKQVNDYTSGSLVSKNYVYMSGFVYMNDTLQYLLTEEGSIKYAKKRNSANGSTYYAYEYDYFIKDHQGNVRTVLTEGKDTAIYQATMETANAGTEDALFAYVQTPVETRHDKPSGFDSDSDNHKVSMLNGSTSVNKRTGPSLVLKVMAGDKVQMNTYAFYNTTVQQPQSGVNLLTDILAILPGAVIGNSSGKLAAENATALEGTLSPNVTEFLNNDRPYDDARPKAYLNWILFDEQFNYVSSNSGVVQVEAGSEKQPLIAPLQTISKNGFLYIYVSNESPMDVYFDDITVKHYTGPLVQEQSYYPFGLQMAGISSKAVLKALTPYKANGGSEFEDEGGLDYYNTFYRKYDAQIGRFTGIDIETESFAGLTPFQFGNNNPVLYNDPMGDKFVLIKPVEQMLNTFQWALHYRETSGGGDYGNGMKITSMWDDMMADIVGGGGGLSAAAKKFIAIRNMINGGAVLNDDGYLGFYFTANVYEGKNKIGILNGFYGVAYPSEDIPSGGVALSLSFISDNPNDDWNNYNWVQTAITNTPKAINCSEHEGGGWFLQPTDEYFTDKVNPCSEEPFYKETAIYRQKRYYDLAEKRKEATAGFNDTPGRNVSQANGNAYWYGNVSLVTVTPANGVGQVILTISYGFYFNNGELMALPLAPLIYMQIPRPK
ncbi:MAG: DUF6443 domain-containing protein [Ferruginibacter sp.]